MRTDVVAVIPSFRPTSQLLDLIAVLLPMVGVVVVADDASPCPFDRALRLARNENRVIVHRFARNQGIARSLNVGLSIARQNEASWLLTVDQDTIIPPGYVSRLVVSAEGAKSDGVRVGVIAPSVIHDASGPITYPSARINGHLSTAEVFQTAALWSVQSLVNIGGFDEYLGMDAVDAEACLSLREAGYAVTLAPDLSFKHSWGATKRVSIFGKPVAITGHSADRRATIVRNRLRIAPREFRASPIHALRSIRRLVVGSALAVSVEDDRMAKLFALGKGFLQSIRTTTRSRRS